MSQIIKRRVGAPGTILSNEQSQMTSPAEQSQAFNRASAIPILESRNMGR